MVRAQVPVATALVAAAVAVGADDTNDDEQAPDTVLLHILCWCCFYSIKPSTKRDHNNMYIGKCVRERRRGSKRERERSKRRKRILRHAKTQV